MDKRQFILEAALRVLPHLAQESAATSAAQIAFDYAEEFAQIAEQRGFIGPQPLGSTGSSALESLHSPGPPVVSHSGEDGPSLGSEGQDAGGSSTETPPASTFKDPFDAARIPDDATDEQYAIFVKQAIAAVKSKDDAHKLFDLLKATRERRKIMTAEDLRRDIVRAYTPVLDQWGIK